MRYSFTSSGTEFSTSGAAYLAAAGGDIDGSAIIKAEAYPAWRFSAPIYNGGDAVFDFSQAHGIKPRQVMVGIYAQNPDFTGIGKSSDVDTRDRVAAAVSDTTGDGVDVVGDGWGCIGRRRWRCP